MQREDSFGARKGPVRAPVYVVVDCSWSMSGGKGVSLDRSPWAAVQLGLQSLVNELEDNRILFDLAYVSVVTFATTARVHAGPALAKNGIDISPLPEPDGFTDFAKMLRCVHGAVKSDIAALNSQKCDIKVPIVFVLTDGHPQTSASLQQPDSEWLPELRKLQEITVQRPSGPRACHVVPFGVGQADRRVLCQLKSALAPAYLLTGDPTEATRRAMLAIVKSVSDSTLRGQLTVSPPPGTETLTCK